MKLKATVHKDVEAKARLFKTLGHSTRLLILNLIRIRPRHGQELAAILDVKPATVSHHLVQLQSARFVQSRQEQYYKVYSLRPAALDRSLSEMICLSQPDLDEYVEADAFQNKVLRTFFDQGQLVRIPAQLKKRQIIMERLALEFEVGRRYSEPEVNMILLPFHEDVATLRRELISFKLMARQRGNYWRVSSDSGQQSGGNVVGT